MSVISVDDVRSLVRSALNDAQLQLVIDREQALLTQRLGAAYADALTTITQTRRGGGASLFLPRRVLTVSTVSERLTAGSDTAAVAATGYFVHGDQGRLERLPQGTRWGEVVTVAYVPADDRAEWRAALLDLVRLQLSRTGLKSESIAGEYSYTAADDWDADRAKIVRRVGFFNL